jgi:hypothetical protein
MPGILPGDFANRAIAVRSAQDAQRLIDQINTDLQSDKVALDNTSSFWHPIKHGEIEREMADEEAIKTITTAMKEGFTANETGWSGNVVQDFDGKGQAAASIRAKIQDLSRAVDALGERTSSTSTSPEEVVRRNILNHGNRVLSDLRTQLGGLETFLRNSAHDKLMATDQAYARNVAERPGHQARKDAAHVATENARMAYGNMSGALNLVSAYLSASNDIAGLEPRVRVLEQRAQRQGERVTAFQQDLATADRNVDSKQGVYDRRVGEKQQVEAQIAYWYSINPAYGPDNVNHPAHARYERLFGLVTTKVAQETRAEQGLRSQQDDLRDINLQIEHYLQDPQNAGRASGDVVAAEQAAKTKWDDAKGELRLAETALRGARSSGDSSRIARAENLYNQKAEVERAAHLAFDQAKANREAGARPSVPQRLLDRKAQAEREVESARTRLADAREELRLARVAAEGFLQSQEAQPVQPTLDPILAVALGAATQRVQDASDDLDVAKRQRGEVQRGLQQEQSAFDDVSGQLSTARAQLESARRALAAGPTWIQDQGPAVSQAMDKLLSAYADYVGKGGTAIKQNGEDSVAKLKDGVAEVFDQARPLNDQQRKERLGRLVQSANAIAIALNGYEQKYGDAERASDSYIGNAVTRLLQQYGM